MHWFVKRYIAKEKGKSVDWAKVAAITI